MSKPRGFRCAVFVLALSLSAAATAQAQTAAALEQTRDSLQRRFKSLRAQLDSAQNRARAVPDDSLLLHGAILKFSSANLDERERRSLTRAFDVAAAELNSIFGRGGDALMAGQTWLVTVNRPLDRRRKPELGLEALRGASRSASVTLKLPLNIEGVTKVVRDQAGRALIRSHPGVSAWNGGVFGIDEPSTTHYFAHRHLALHQSSPARRCARGGIPACKDIFDPAARARWFDSTDEVNAERVPASGIVRESVLRYAVEVDGAAVLRAFRSPADTTAAPLQFIAAAVGQEPDEFLEGWQARVAESGAIRVRALPRNVLAAFGWFAFAGFIATRRRPQ